MSMAIVGIAGIAVAAAGTAYSANSAKKAGQAANNANERMQQEENQRKQDNYDAGTKRIWGDQQGATRDSILSLRDQLKQVYAGSGDKTAGIVDSYNGANAANYNYANQLATGQNLTDRLGNLQPVLDARTSAVTAQRDAYTNAYQQLQAKRKAAQMQQGFFGGGSFADRLGRADLIGLNTNIANAGSAARLQNAQDRYGVQEDDYTRRLSSIMLPYQLMQAGVTANNLKTQGYSDEQTAPMTAMLNQLGQFSQMTPFSPETASVPTAQVVPTNGVGTALSQLGQVGASYAMNQYQANQQAARDKAMIDQLGLLQSGGTGTWQATNTYQGSGAPAATPYTGSGFAF